MKKPGTLLVAAVSLPFLTGCFSVLPAPIPTTPAEREQVDLRGVVVRGDNGSDDERVEFSEVLDVQWLDGGLEVVGLDIADDEARTQQFFYNDLAAVLTRQLDANKTSILIGGVMLSTIAAIAFIVNGQGDRGSSVPIG